MSKEYYTPTPYHQRPSQNLGVGEYMKDRGFFLSLPLIGSLAGALLNKPTNGLINGWKGFLASFTVSAFFLWRKDEKKRLEVAETVAEVKDIAHLHQTNEDLQKDNKLVEKMIAFEKEKQAELTAEGGYREKITQQTSAEPTTGRSY